MQCAQQVLLELCPVLASRSTSVGLGLGRMRAPSVGVVRMDLFEVVGVLVEAPEKLGG